MTALVDEGLSILTRLGWFRRVLGAALAVVCVIYFLSFASTNLEKLHDLEFSRDALLLLLLPLLVISVSNTVLPAYGWTLLLNDFGQRGPFAPKLWVYAYTQIAKYLPGNVGHHVGRVAVAKRFGYSRKLVAWSVLVEGVFLLASATIQGVLVLWLASPLLDIAFDSPVDIRFVVLPVGAGLGLLVLSIGLVNHWRPAWLDKRLGSWILPIPSFSVFGSYLLVITVNALVMGWALNYVGWVMFEIDFSRYWLLLAAWAIAWVVGFVLPGVPGGLGVREGIMAGILSPVLGGGETLGLVLVHRVLLTVAEGLVFVIAVLAKPRIERNHVSET